MQEHEVADSNSWGYLGGAVTFGGASLAVYLLYRLTSTSKAGLFWGTFS